MKPQGTDSFSTLEPCVNRKGISHNNRMIMSCGGLEVLPEECSGCTGKIKTKLSFRQLLTQKAKELDMVFKKKGDKMEWMSNEQIAEKLDIVKVKESKWNFFGKKNKVKDGAK